VHTESLNFLHMYHYPSLTTAESVQLSSSSQCLGYCYTVKWNGSSASFFLLSNPWLAQSSYLVPGCYNRKAISSPSCHFTHWVTNVNSTLINFNRLNCLYTLWCKYLSSQGWRGSRGWNSSPLFYPYREPGGIIRELSDRVLGFPPPLDSWVGTWPAERRQLVNLGSCTYTLLRIILCYFSHSTARKYDRQWLNQTQIWQVLVRS
jgi:hypothetical protein